MGLLDLLNLPQLPVPGVAPPPPKPQPGPMSITPTVPLDTSQIIDTRTGVPKVANTAGYMMQSLVPNLFNTMAPISPPSLAPPLINPVVKPASDSSYQMLLGLLRFHAQNQPKGKGGRRGVVSPYATNPSITGGAAQPGLHGSIVYDRSTASLPKTIPNLRTIHGATMQAPAIASLVALHKATGAQIFGAIGSSYRDYAQQVAVYNHNTPLGLPAASPGSSYHEQGLAMDLNSTWVNNNPKAMQWLSDHGWHSGASFNDPYHWTYGVIG